MTLRPRTTGEGSDDAWLSFPSRSRGRVWPSSVPCSVSTASSRPSAAEKYSRPPAPTTGAEVVLTAVSSRHRSAGAAPGRTSTASSVPPRSRSRAVSPATTVSGPFIRKGSGIRVARRGPGS